MNIRSLARDFWVEQLGLILSDVWMLTCIAAVLLSVALLSVVSFGWLVATKGRESSHGRKKLLRLHIISVVIFDIATIVAVLLIESLVWLNDGAWMVGIVVYLHYCLVVIFILLWPVVHFKNGLRCKYHHRFAYTFFSSATALFGTGGYLLLQYPFR